MKRFKLLLLGLCVVFAAAAGAAITAGALERSSTLAVQCDRPGHGTHLCSDDSHCGSGHKCCSGHCKWVDTCG